MRSVENLQMEEQKMKLKNSEIVQFMNGVARLKSKKLPAKVVYAVKKNIRSMEAAALVYNETFEEICDRCVKKDKNGKPQTKDGRFCFVKEKEEEFNTAVQELRDIETEIEVLTISLEELEKCDDSRYDPLSVEDMEALYFMLG